MLMKVLVVVIIELYDVVELVVDVLVDVEVL